MSILRLGVTPLAPTSQLRRSIRFYQETVPEQVTDLPSNFTALMYDSVNDLLRIENMSGKRDKDTVVTWPMDNVRDLSGGVYTGADNKARFLYIVNHM